MSNEKQECPFCGKKYKNLKSHITRVHMDKNGSQVKGKNIDELEASISNKIIEDQNQKKEIKSKKSIKKQEKKKSKNSFEKIVEVDLWLTNIHDAEMGVFQKERFMAKNRLFTRNLELVGAVHEKGESDGMFGYDSRSWDDLPLKDLAKKRLIIKWFNSKSVGWLGTIEEMVVNSISSSIGADDTLPSFKIILPRYKYVVNLQKEHTKFPKIGEIFTFALKDKKKDRWSIYSFNEKRLTVGSDWDILIGDHKDKVIGKINEKVLNIGGKFKVHFYDKNYHKDLRFFRVVILFTMMLKYKQEILDKIEKLIKYIDEGRIILDIAADEERFMMNPRALKR
ncbi:MAG: hypothetical protein ACTSWY_13055 [Promethearchaeota archaeon]